MTTPTSITAVRADLSTITYYPARQYYRVLQDDEMPFYTNRDDSMGKPMVFRYDPFKSIWMTKAIQFFWYNLNRSDNEAADKAAWTGYTDAAWCNDGKVRDSCDFINGERLGFPLPKMARLICGLNVVCGTEMVDGSLQLETIDPNNLPVGMTHATHPHLIHVANIIFPSIAPNGLRTVNAFPQMGGREGRPVYYPLWGNEAVFYPMRQLQKLPFGSKLPPFYNPGS